MDSLKPSVTTHHACGLVLRFKKFVHPGRITFKHSNPKSPMKRNVLLAAMMLVSGSLFAADPKDDVTSAAKKLAAADNYSWKGNVENAGGGGRFGGPSEGKADQDGTVYFTMTPCR